MPLAWIPKSKNIEQQITENLSKIEALKAQRDMMMLATPVLAPAITPVIPQQPTYMPQVQQPTRAIRQVVKTTAVAARVSVLPETAKIMPEEVVAPIVPFWQRALQVFAAPFQWVQENVINPVESIAFSAVIPNLPREQGESYFNWKRREIDAWQTPGVELNVPWRDTPVRVDIKGILEFAPWLFIPGAGQVGAGARGAVGLAGMLGKMGRIGRVVGTAVEYSPWGLVEKTAGVAMKAGIKGVTGVTGKVSTKVGERLFGKIEQPPVSPAVQEITKVFNDVVNPAYKAFREAEPALRARQAAAIEAVAKDYRTGKISATEWAALSQKATAGEIKTQFAVSPQLISPKTYEELQGMIVNSMEKGFVQRDAAGALQDLFLNGTLPEAHNIRDFAKIFGLDFAKAVSKLRDVAPSKLDNIIDLLNMPRAVLASTDVSYVARQGLILGLIHPTLVPRAFARSIKSYFSEKLALDMDDVLRSKPITQEFLKRNGSYLAPIRAGAPLMQWEETYMSKLGQNLPFVKRSQRAFNTYMNELRVGSYETGANVLTALSSSDADKDMLARFISLASGRGDLPKNIEKFTPLFNAFLFSPKLQMSRLQLPVQIGRMLFSGNPYMRKEAAKALVTFVGGGLSLLMLLKAGGNKVEFDPRSGDFGKIKIGETRLDIWTGYIQYARFVAQLVTAERKTAYGNLNKAKRDEIAWRFLQGKSSPAVGMFVDLLRGQTYMGDEMFKDTNDLIKMAKERLMPLALQDVIDAMEQSGVNGAWTAIPASLGVGTLTYINDYTLAQNKVAKQLGYDSWDKIDPLTQRKLENTNAELQAAYIELDRQVMGTAWGQWRSAGQAIDNVFRDNVDEAVAQYRDTGNGVQFREKIGDAFTARRGGYDARNQNPQFVEQVKRLNTQDTAQAMVSLGPEQTAIKIYNDALYGDDMYDQYGDYRFDEADIRKEQLRQQLGDALFNYVEEYQTLKFETLPPEFQELTKAKQILRPYWKVEDDVKRLFGDRFSESSAGQSLISKRRKIMRLGNAEMAKYWQMFYSRSMV